MMESTKPVVNKNTTSNDAWWDKGYFHGIAATSYLFLAIYFYAMMWNVNQTPNCRVRYAYRTELMSTLVGNPAYTSTKVWRNPPLSAMEIASGSSAYDQQRVADLGIFPVFIEDMERDAAFLSPAPVPMAGRQVTAGGLLMSSVQEITDMFHGVLRDGSSVTQANVGRCLSLTGKGENLRTVAEIDAYRTSSGYRGACVLNGQQQVVDVVDNYKTTTTSFSSINIYFFPHLIFMLAFGFQVHMLKGYATKPTADAQKDIMTWLSNAFMNLLAFWDSAANRLYFAVVAHIIGIAAALAPAYFPESVRVPANNIMIAIAVYTASAAAQVAWFSQRDDMAAVDTYRSTKKNDLETASTSTKDRLAAGISRAAFSCMDAAATTPLLLVYTVVMFSREAIPVGILQMVFLTSFFGRMLSLVLVDMHRLVPSTKSVIKDDIFGNLFWWARLAGVVALILLLVINLLVCLSFSETGHVHALIGFAIAYEWLSLLTVLVYVMVYNADTISENKWTFSSYVMNAGGVLNWVLRCAIGIWVLVQLADDKGMDRYMCSLWAHLQGVPPSAAVAG